MALIETAGLVVLLGATYAAAFYHGSRSRARRTLDSDDDRRPTPSAVGESIPSSVKRQGYQSRKTKAEAQRAELELEWRRGELVEVETVRDLLEQTASVGPGTTAKICEALTREEPEP